MSNRLERCVHGLRAERRRGLAPFVTAGDGGFETTLAVLEALEASGVACVELGLPFSDPIADGPILQAAAQRALDSGVTFEGVLELIASFRARGGELPIVLMGYANPLLRRTWPASTRALAAAGADALLVADLPVEEGGAMRAAALEAGLCPIFFASPTSSDARIAASIAASRGFLYTILRTGVTGRATAIDADALCFLARVRALVGDLGLAVGFGIASAEHVRAAVAHADLAIVGSALVDAIDRASRGAASERPARAAQTARDFVHALQKGLSP